MKSIILSLALAFATLHTRTTFASNTESYFHNLFVTAGYSTAFGAALGAAFIGLSDKPEDNLNYLAMGASSGFITGSLIGTYMIFRARSTTEFGIESRNRFEWSPFVYSQGKGLGLMTSLTLD